MGVFLFSQENTLQAYFYWLVKYEGIYVWKKLLE